MILIWVVQFRLCNGKLITFRDQSVGNSKEEILAVLDNIFYDFQIRERADLVAFEYIIRFTN
jgi:hypothetical protein